MPFFDKQKAHLSCDMDNFLDEYEAHRGANNENFIVSNGGMSQAVKKQFLWLNHQRLVATYKAMDCHRLGFLIVMKKKKKTTYSYCAKSHSTITGTAAWKYLLIVVYECIMR